MAIQPWEFGWRASTHLKKECLFIESPRNICLVYVLINLLIWKLLVRTGIENWLMRTLMMVKNLVRKCWKQGWPGILKNIILTQYWHNLKQKPRILKKVYGRLIIQCHLGSTSHSTNRVYLQKTLLSLLIVTIWIPCFQIKAWLLII